MKKHTIVKATLAAAPLLLSLGSPVAQAGVAGITDQAGTPGDGSAQFDLYARSGNIVLGDGNSLVAWGYSPSAAGLSAGGIPAPMQYPGPTLIVKEGDAVTVTLRNGLLVPTSIIFPGQTGVTASACPTGTAVQGLMTLEAPAATSLNGTDGGCVTYRFTASRPGTFSYQSGTRPALEVEMGLVGALIVRPLDFDEGIHESHPARTAYGTPAAGPGSVPGYQPTHYDREYLFFLTEMDRSAHEAVDTRQQAFAAGSYTSFDDPALDEVPGTTIDPAGYKATLWFLNGRNGPDTMLERNVDWMPTQPYNALPRAHAGERVLMRLVGAGRDLHPFHHHGNNAWLIARDGQLLESAGGTPASYPDYNCIPEFDPAYATHVASGLCPNLYATAKATPGQATLPDEAISNYTIQVVPGSTYDAIFTWTGRGLNWDIYGSSPGHSVGAGTCDESTRLPGEDPISHCHQFNDPMGVRNFPVTLPEQQSLTFGGFWSGGPYLGTDEPIPPLQGGLNPGAGYSYMWHSHTERELTNDDVFPGGMMTMFILEKEPEVCPGGLHPDNINDDGTFNTTPATCPVVP